MTGLENRNKLINDLCIEKYTKLTIVDIRSFNDINDFYGNTIGDKVLKDISKLISWYCKENKLNSYRVNSDIFAIASSDISKEDFIARIQFLQNEINNQCFVYEEGKIF